MSDVVSSLYTCASLSMVSNNFTLNADAKLRIESMGTNFRKCIKNLRAARGFVSMRVSHLPITRGRKWDQISLYQRYYAQYLSTTSALGLSKGKNDFNSKAVIRRATWSRSSSNRCTNCSSATTFQNFMARKSVGPIFSYMKKWTKGHKSTCI